MQKVTGRFAQKPVPPWDDSTGTIRAKNRTGRFAQKNWDDSLKIKFIYDKCFALQMRFDSNLSKHVNVGSDSTLCHIFFLIII